MMVVRILPMAYSMGDQIRPRMDLRRQQHGERLPQQSKHKEDGAVATEHAENFRSVPARRTGSQTIIHTKNPLWHY